MIASLVPTKLEQTKFLLFTFGTFGYLIQVFAYYGSELKAFPTSLGRIRFWLSKSIVGINKHASFGLDVKYILLVMAFKML